MSSLNHNINSDLLEVEQYVNELTNRKSALLLAPKKHKSVYYSPPLTSKPKHSRLYPTTQVLMSPDIISHYPTFSIHRSSDSANLKKFFDSNAKTSLLAKHFYRPIKNVSLSKKYANLLIKKASLLALNSCRAAKEYTSEKVTPFLSVQGNKLADKRVSFIAHNQKQNCCSINRFAAPIKGFMHSNCKE